MSVAYDSAVIVKFAADLYEKAKGIVIRWTIFFLLIGLASGAYLSKSTSAPNSPPSFAGLAIGGVIGAIVGYMVGSSAAFKLRLQAQIALCQVAIEQNTRRDKSL